MEEGLRLHLKNGNRLLLLLGRQALPIEGCCHVCHDADILLGAEGLPHS